MEKRVFKLYQYKDDEGLGCTLQILTIIAYLFLGFFFIDKLGAAGAMLPIGMVMVAWYFIRRRSRSFCKVTVDEDGFTVEVVTPSAEIRVGKNTFVWSDLQEFEYYYGKSGQWVHLYIANVEKIVLTGYECSHFASFLKKHFPEKERK